jgi:hypothetical protein
MFFEKQQFFWLLWPSQEIFLGLNPHALPFQSRDASFVVDGQRGKWYGYSSELGLEVLDITY